MGAPAGWHQGFGGSCGERRGPSLEGVGRQPPGTHGSQGGGIAGILRRPQYLLPGLVVVGMLAIVFGLQPKGPSTPAGADDEPTPFRTAEPTSTPTEGAFPTATPGTEPEAGATSEVAGARSTPEATPTEDPDLASAPSECGDVQEASYAMSVEQTLAGAAVQATQTSIYPVDYLRCILLATGGKEAVSLASALGKAGREGATHAVLVDLWITNSSRDFVQIDLKNSTFSAVGQTFAPLATLGGRAEVVVSSGQGRNVTLVGTLTNTLSENTGPITVSIDAPRLGGEPTPGKYQLFLPTP